MKAIAFLTGAVEWLLRHPADQVKAIADHRTSDTVQGSGLGDSVAQELVAGSYASVVRNASTSCLVVTSPPATKILRPSVPQPPLRGVGIRSLGATEQIRNLLPQGEPLRALVRW